MLTKFRLTFVWDSKH